VNGTVEIIVQLGALGALIVVLAWAFKVLMPRLFAQADQCRRDFREELALERDARFSDRESFREELGKERIQRIEAATAVRALSSVVRHCPHNGDDP
jgi:hypothetical protein